MPQIHELGVAGLRAGLASGELTSTAIVRALLARIEALEPTVNAMIALAPDALDQAGAADERRARGAVLGPLDGIPVIIKDNIEAVGLPGTAGSLALAAHPPGRDAPLVSRMRAAGLVLLGAANLSEWANLRGEASTSGWSAVGGLTANPWRASASPGGSSAGCGAALAAGYAPLAVGTETDGSVVCPASMCGVVGLKPTVGSIPAAGIVPIAASQDTAGAMARSVGDAGELFAVLSGSAPDGVPSAPAPRTRRLGRARSWSSQDQETEDLLSGVLDALAAGGFEIVELDVPVPDEEVSADEIAVLTLEMGDDLDAYLAGRPGAGPRSVAEVVDFNREHGEAELAHFGQEYLERAAAGGGRADPSYAAARSRNLDWARRQALAALAGPQAPDALVGLAYGPAWESTLAGGDVVVTGVGTHASAIAGWPLLSLPIGLVRGLPVGLLLAGRPGEEQRLLELATHAETLVGWADRLAPDPTNRAVN